MRRLVMYVVVLVCAASACAKSTQGSGSPASVQQPSLSSSSSVTPACAGTAGPVQAKIGLPYGVLIGNNCALIVSDQDKGQVVSIAKDGAVSVVAGDPTASLPGDGGPATKAALAFIKGIARDSAGDLYLAEAHAVRKINPDGMISTVAGNVADTACKFLPRMEGGSARAASICPSQVAVDTAGDLLVSDSSASRVFKIAADGVITTFAGGGTEQITSGPATKEELLFPDGIAVDAAGDTYIADGNAYTVYKVTPAGAISIFAGGGSALLKDGAAATSADIGNPLGLALDVAGNLLIGTWTHLIAVNPAGIITVLAGHSTTTASGGDGGPALKADFDRIEAVAVDPAGNTYLSDTGNKELRRITPAGTITAVA